MVDQLRRVGWVRNVHRASKSLNRLKGLNIKPRRPISSIFSNNLSGSSDKVFIATRTIGFPKKINQENVQIFPIKPSTLLPVKVLNPCSKQTPTP